MSMESKRLFTRLIDNRVSRRGYTPDLTEVSRKTGLIVRSLDSAAMEKLFDELEG